MARAPKRKMLEGAGSSKPIISTANEPSKSGHLTDNRTSKPSNPSDNTAQQPKFRRRPHYKKLDFASIPDLEVALKQVTIQSGTPKSPGKYINDMPPEILSQILSYLAPHAAWYGERRIMTVYPRRQCFAALGGDESIPCADRFEGLRLYIKDPVTTATTIPIAMCHINQKLRAIGLERIFAQTEFWLSKEVWGSKPWNHQLNWLSMMNETLEGTALTKIKFMTVRIDIGFDFFEDRPRHGSIENHLDHLAHWARYKLLFIGDLLYEAFERGHQLDKAANPKNAPRKILTCHHIETDLYETYSIDIAWRRPVEPKLPYMILYICTPGDVRRLRLVIVLQRPREFRASQDEAWTQFKDKFVHDLQATWLPDRVLGPFAGKYGWKIEGTLVAPPPSPVISEEEEEARVTGNGGQVDEFVVPDPHKNEFW